MRDAVDSDAEVIRNAMERGPEPTLRRAGRTRGAGYLGPQSVESGAGQYPGRHISSNGTAPHRARCLALDLSLTGVGLRVSAGFQWRIYGGKGGTRTLGVALTIQ